MRRAFAVFTAAIAIGFGLVVLIGYFIPSNPPNLLVQMRIFIIDLAVTLAGFATLVAVLSLVGTHWRKLRARRNPDRYSIWTLIFFLITVAWGVWAYLPGQNSTTTGQNSFLIAVTAIQAPIETSLTALLAVVLVLATFRLFQRRAGLLTTVFVISAIVFLFLNSGVLYGNPNNLIGEIVYGIQTLPLAGGRGILLGIALGSILAGLRILLGLERPYSG